MRGLEMILLVVVSIFIMLFTAVGLFTVLGPQEGAPLVFYSTTAEAVISIALCGVLMFLPRQRRR